MFEFFIALFGGLYWGGKYLKDTTETQIRRHEVKSSEEERVLRKKEFERKVVDEKLEAYLEDFIYNTANYDAVQKEVLKAYNEMPWKSDEEKFICVCPEAVETVFGKGVYTKKQREQIAANHRREALRIMLANRGKLTYSDAVWGVQTSGVSAPTTLMAQQWNIETANFVLWMNQKLKKHGVYEMVVLNSGFNDWYQVTEANKVKNGTYYWYPSIPAINVHIKP